MAAQHEVRVSVHTKEGDQYDATASLGKGEKLHVKTDEGGITLYISNGGEVCTTRQGAKDLQRD